MNNKTYFIADIGANHDGSLERAEKLCTLAKESNADAVKFQHFKAETIVSNYGFENLSSNESHQSSWKQSIYKVYEDASIPIEWTTHLKNHCDDIGVDFFTTPYDLDYVDLLDPFISIYKIGSGDITWSAMLHRVGAKKKPIIISTGAASLDEITKAVDIVSSYNVPVTLLQCNTNYTGKDDNFNHINLNVLKVYRELYPHVSIGLSDHTPGDVTVLGAVALGATVIEKHFTDNTSRDGPDHSFAMDTTTWRKMVKRTRLLEKALGSPIKKIEDNEEATVIAQRRAIRVNKSKTKGSMLFEEDLEFLRPCPADAIPPYVNVVSKLLSRNVVAGDYIRVNDLQ